MVNSDEPVSSYKELIQAKVSELPEHDRKPSWTIGLAAVSAFVLNSHLKRALFLYEGTIATGGICMLTAALSNYGFHKMAENSLLSDPSVCTVCAVIRGGIIQGVSSSVIPVAASFSMGGIVGERYGSVNAPDFTWKNRREFWKFWGPKFKQIKMPFLISFGLQAAFGCYYTYRRKTAIDKVHDSVSGEEIADIIGAQLREVGKVQSYNS